MRGSLCDAPLRACCKNANSGVEDPLWGSIRPKQALLRPLEAGFPSFRDLATANTMDRASRRTFATGSDRMVLVWEPKLRRICSAGYLDRVVHHAVSDLVDPLSSLPGRRYIRVPKGVECPCVVCRNWRESVRMHPASAGIDTICNYA